MAWVPARVFEYAAEDLERGWKAAQQKQSKAPRFEHYDPLVGGFAVDGTIRVDGAHIVLPRLGTLRLSPHGRERVPDGKYAFARIVRHPLVAQKASNRVGVAPIAVAPFPMLLLPVPGFLNRSSRPSVSTSVR